MVETVKPDLFGLRPSSESTEEAQENIRAELQGAGIDMWGATITRGHDDPGGMTVYYVYLSSVQTVRDEK